MYNPSSFYLSTCAASTLTFLMYPLIVSAVSFGLFRIDDHSFTTFLEWTAILLLQATAGFSFGMMLGTIISAENSAINSNLMCVMFFSFGGGMYANTGMDSNYLIRAISYISPIRFSSELLLRILMRKKEEK